MNNFYSLFLNSNGNKIELFSSPTLSANYSLAFPAVAPANQQILIWNNTTSSFDWVTFDSTGFNSTPSSTYTLNTDEAGTPSTDAFYSVNRGTSATASLKWNESTDKWESGVTGGFFPIASRFSQSFTSTDISGGILTVTHNLSARPLVEIINNLGESIGCSVNHIDASSLNINMSRMGTITGSWQVIAIA